MGSILLSTNLDNQLHLSDCIRHRPVQLRSVLVFTVSPSPFDVDHPGKYGLIRVPNGPLDQTFSSDLLMEASTVHCLDFYYYLTDALANEKIEVGWKSDTESQVLGEVVSDPAPKWQQRRIEFTSSFAESYKVRRERQGLGRYAIVCRSGSD